MVIIKKHDGEEEPVLRLRLEENEGGVVLYAVNEDGTMLNSGNILRIESDGKLHLQNWIDRGLPIEFSETRAIEIGEPY